MTEKKPEVLEDNILKKSLNIAQLPNQNGDINQALLEILLRREDNKKEILDKFISNPLQKTEISRSERKILPILEILANTPFPDLEDCNINPDRKPLTDKQREYLYKEFELGFLQYYLYRYGELGIPVNREGRKEEVEVLRTFLNDEIEIKNTGNKSNFQ